MDDRVVTQVFLQRRGAVDGYYQPSLTDEKRSLAEREGWMSWNPVKYKSCNASGPHDLLARQ
jgi:hypothetical protein